MGRKQQPEPEPDDPTGFLLNSALAGFLLMHTKEIKYMCMFAYTVLHGASIYTILLLYSRVYISYTRFL
jgi:hypothetical protein